MCCQITKLTVPYFVRRYMYPRCPIRCLAQFQMRLDSPVAELSHLLGIYLQPYYLLLSLIKYSLQNIKNNMLDSFEILTTSGVVLWSRSYTETSDPSIINSLISSVFIEEKTLPGAGIADDVSAANNPPFKHDQHTLKWTTVKELGLIFVVSCFATF